MLGKINCVLSPKIREKKKKKDIKNGLVKVLIKIKDNISIKS